MHVTCHDEDDNNNAENYSTNHSYWSTHAMMITNSNNESLGTTVSHSDDNDNDNNPMNNYNHCYYDHCFFMIIMALMFNNQQTRLDNDTGDIQPVSW